MKATMELPTTTNDTPAIAAVGAAMQVQLKLDQISLDPITDVRTGPVAKDEAKKIDELAKSMYEDGQLQPIVVRPNGNDGHYLLVAGRRRFAAKKLMAELAAAGKLPDLTGKEVVIDAVVVNKNDDEAWSASLQENLQRRQFSAIELAQNIIEIKKRKNLDGPDWTAHVADFLKVSRATVSQHAKLLDLPKDIQTRVHKGELSAQSAFDIRDVQEKQGAAKAVEVARRAEELAEQEAAEEAAKPKSRKSKAEPDAEKGKVKRKHVLAAAREADATVKPRTRNEIIGFFNEILESTDAYPEPIVDLCKVITGKWAAGQVGDRAVRNKLDIIAEMISDKPAKAKKTANKTAAA